MNSIKNIALIQLTLRNHLKFCYKRSMILMLLWAGTLSAGAQQGVRIAEDQGDPHPSAVLELASSDHGFLTPRLTSVERDAITNPANGLLIFNLTTECFNYFMGGSWFALCGICVPQPPPAMAGQDQLNLEGTEAILGANTPAVGQGMWSVVSGEGGSFGDEFSPVSSFIGTSGETYVLRWSITTSCGSESDELTVSFLPSFTCGTTTVQDASGNTYGTVQVGAQCWLKQNLRTTKYSDGSNISTSHMLQWGVGGAPSCNASNFNATSCGILYEGHVMQNAVSPCPDGWHIPRRNEYEALYSAVGNDSRRLFHPSAGCSSNCTGFDLYICGQNYVQWEGCGAGDQIYLWTRPNTGNTFTSSFITQYNSGSGGVTYNTVLSQYIDYNYSIRCVKD